MGYQNQTTLWFEYQQAFSESINLAYFKQKGLKKIPSHEALPVSVPGAVDGWFSLHKRFGKLKMRDILNPSIQYAESGFPVTELISYYMNRSIPFFIRKGFPNIKETYTIDGKAPQKSYLIKVVARFVWKVALITKPFSG